MNAANGPRTDGAEGGFALLVLLLVLGAGSVAIVLAAQALVPTLADRAATAEARLAIAQDAVRTAYRRSGAFPPDLAALAAAAGLAVDGAWRVDPYGAAQDLDYAVTGSAVRLRSRGPDGRLGTADDLRSDVAEETPLRDRQRARLRLIRAVLLRSPYRLAATMTAADVAAMRAAMRDHALARREWLTADAAARAALTARMASAAAAIANLATAHALPPLPPAVTGAGGLMNQLGLPDARAVDGRGRPLAGEPSLGVVAVGSDGIGGSDDDM